MTTIKELHRSWIIAKGDCKIVLEVDYSGKKPMIAIRPHDQESFFFDTVMRGETINKWKDIVGLIDKSLEFIRSTARACDDEI